MEVEERINKQIADNPVLIYMKGSPDAPMCGFSAQSVQALKLCDAEFAYVNILEEPEIRSTLKVMANWPTFPQLYVNGELIGGCDIIVESYRSGELQDMMKNAADKAAS